jgi:outer membrane lipoprotein
MKRSLIGFVLILLLGAFEIPANAEDIESAPAPPETQSSVSFAELQANPEAYQGQEIVLGGKVITARQYFDTTQIEVMQLPLGPGQQPEPNQALTQGRFLAFQKTGLNPMTIPPGTFVTVAGQIVGSAVPDPAQTTAAYPVLEVKNLTVWPAAAPAPAQMIPPAPADASPTPPVSETTIIDHYYYAPYWDPVVSVWFWRPFWVYPWWWTSPVIVVPPRLAIVRPFPIPFGPPPRRFGPLPPQFIPRHGPVGVAPAPPIGFPPRPIAPIAPHVAPHVQPRVVPPQFSRGLPSPPEHVAPVAPSHDPPVQQMVPPQQSIPPQFNRRSPEAPQFNHRPAETPQFNRPSAQAPRAEFRGSRPSGSVQGGNGSGSQNGRGGHRG